MKIALETDVDRQPDLVWAFFQDIDEVVKCLPGAHLTGRTADEAYEGTVLVKLGPMAITFEGRATVEADAASRTGRIAGSGVDRRGGSRGKLVVEYTLTPAAGGTRVLVDAEVQLSGPAAQFGRVGLIKEMSERLVEEFVACLDAKLDAPDTEAAGMIQRDTVAGGSLFLRSIVGLIARFLRRIFGREPTRERDRE